MPFDTAEKQREYHRQWYAKNRERKRVKVAAWRAANPDKFAANHKRWYSENKERCKAVAEATRTAHPDKYTATQRKSCANCHRIRTRGRRKQVAKLRAL